MERSDKEIRGNMALARQTNFSKDDMRSIYILKQNYLHLYKA